jgi:hypothetical protein
MVRVDISRKSPFLMTSRVVHRACHGRARQPQGTRKGARHSVLSPVAIDRPIEACTAVLHEKPSPRGKNYTSRSRAVTRSSTKPRFCDCGLAQSPIRATNGLSRVAWSSNERHRHSPVKHRVIDAAFRTSQCRCAWHRSKRACRRSPDDATRRDTATTDRPRAAVRCVRGTRQA